MAQVDTNPTAEFDPSAPPNSLIGLEYFIPGIKESSVKRAIFCILVTERVRRLEAGERKIVVDLLFKRAFEKLICETTLLCCGCGKSIPWEHFLDDPFGVVCSESESCEKDRVRKNLVKIYLELSVELIDLENGVRKDLQDDAIHNSISNHPADQNRQPNITMGSRIPSIKKLLFQYKTAIKMHDNGTYGICIDCDEAIDPARLAVSPNANRCISCKNEIEEKGKVTNCFGRKVALSHLNQVII